MPLRETDPWCRPSRFSVTRLEPPALCGRARDRRHRQCSFLGYLRALQRALITDSHLRTMDTEGGRGQEPYRTGLLLPRGFLAQLRFRPEVITWASGMILPTMWPIR